MCGKSYAEVSQAAALWSAWTGGFREHASTLRPLQMNAAEECTVSALRRLMNHSCEPSLQSLEVVQLRGYFRILFVATRHIHPGDELTIDYSACLDFRRAPLRWPALCLGYFRSDKPEPCRHGELVLHHVESGVQWCMERVAW